MEKILERLEQILNREEECHRSFLNVARELNKALRENNITEIDKLRKIHDETICYIERLEEERLNCCATLKQLLGLKTSQLKISILINFIPAKWKDRFITLQKKIKKILEELSSVTISNRIIIEESIRVMNTSISNIYKLNNKYYCYKRSGKDEKTYLFNSILNKTV